MWLRQDWIVCVGSDCIKTQAVVTTFALNLRGGFVRLTTTTHHVVQMPVSIECQHDFHDDDVDFTSESLKPLVTITLSIAINFMVTSVAWNRDFHQDLWKWPYDLHCCVRH